MRSELSHETAMSMARWLLAIVFIGSGACAVEMYLRTGSILLAIAVFGLIDLASVLAFGIAFMAIKFVLVNTLWRHH